MGWERKLKNNQLQAIDNRRVVIILKIPCNSGGTLPEGYATGGVSPAEKVCQIYKVTPKSMKEWKPRARPVGSALVRRPPKAAPRSRGQHQLFVRFQNFVRISAQGQPIITCANLNNEQTHNYENTTTIIPVESEIKLSIPNS
jgi:hypothetical protein